MRVRVYVFIYITVLYKYTKIAAAFWLAKNERRKGVTLKEKLI